MGYLTLIWTQRNGILWVGDSFAPRARPRLDFSRYIYLMISRVAAEVRGDTTHCFTTSAWVLGGGGNRTRGSSLVIGTTLVGCRTSVRIPSGVPLMQSYVRSQCRAHPLAWKLRLFNLFI